jgi:hypothetical protein
MGIAIFDINPYQTAKNIGVSPNHLNLHLKKISQIISLSLESKFFIAQRNIYNDSKEYLN